MEPIRIVASQNIVGKSALWHYEEQAIYWVDIDGKKIQRFFPEKHIYESFDLPKKYV